MIISSEWVSFGQQCWWQFLKVGDIFQIVHTIILMLEITELEINYHQHLSSLESLLVVDDSSAIVVNQKIIVLLGESVYWNPHLLQTINRLFSLLTTWVYHLYFQYVVECSSDFVFTIPLYIVLHLASPFIYKPVQ